MDGFEDRQHAWEAGYERTWDLVQEDQEGNIVTVQADQERARRLKASRITQSIRRGLIRYLYVAVDTSISMKATDMRPTRLAVVREALQGFVRQFFDENPLGQLGLLRTYDRKAEALTDLSGNPKAHVDKLAKLTDVQGLPSLQNILELACVRLQHIPDYGQRELLIVYGSLSTTDPGDIFETIARVKAMRIRVSVICVAAELHIAHKVAEETNGTFAVSLDAVHLRELISGFVSPPPALESEATAFAELVRIGFPARKHFDVPIFTYDGDAITTSSVVYVCPKCHSRVTELPTQCPVCGLQLVKFFFALLCFGSFGLLSRICFECFVAF